MNIKGILVGVTIVTMIILGSISYLSGLQSGYSESINLTGFDNTNKTLTAHQERINETYEVVRDLQFRDTTSFVLIPYDMLRLAWNSMKVVFSSINVIFSMITDFLTAPALLGMPLPSWLLPSIISLVVISVIVMLIYLYFRWKVED